MNLLSISMYLSTCSSFDKTHLVTQTLKQITKGKNKTVRNYYLRARNGTNLQCTFYSVIHMFNLAEEDPKDAWKPKDSKFEDIGERTARVNGIASAFQKLDNTGSWLNEANNRFTVVENVSYSSKQKRCYFLVTETVLLDKLDNLK